MSQMVFVDNFNTPKIKRILINSLYRTIFNFNIEELKREDRLFLRAMHPMFYNFYTTKSNYKLMQYIATPLE